MSGELAIGMRVRILVPLLDEIKDRGVIAAVLFLGTIKVFPPVLFLAMLAVCLAGLVWASWKISHPSTKRQEPFHSAPTEPVRSIR